MSKHCGYTPAAFTQLTSIKVQRAVSDLRHSRPALIGHVCQRAKRRARAGHRAQPPSLAHLARPARCVSLALARKPPRARAGARGVWPRSAAVVGLAARVRACPLGCWIQAQAFRVYVVVGLAAWVRAGRVGILNRNPEPGGPESVFKVQRGALQGAQAQGVCHGADAGVGWIRVCLLPFVGWMRGCLLPVAGGC